MQQGWWRSCLLRTLLRFGAPKVASSYPLRWAQAVATYKCHTHTHSTYTSRIWCIFEIYTAVCLDKPITLIMPEVRVDQRVEKLEELIHICRVDAAEATASITSDEEKIKKHILNTHGSFNQVNEIVQEKLWTELIKIKSTPDTLAFRHSSSRLDPPVSRTNRSSHEGCHVQ